MAARKKKTPQLDTSTAVEVSSLSGILIVGTESFLVDREVEGFKAALRKKHPHARFYTHAGADTTWARLVDVLGQVSVQDDEEVPLRVFIVDGIEDVKQPPPKAFECPVQLASDVLVLVCRKEKVPKWWEPLTKKCKTVEHQELKTYANNNQVVKWIEREAEKLGVNLDANLPAVMYRMVGSDLQVLYQDLQKIATAKGTTSEPLTLKDVADYLTRGSSVDVYQVVDAAVAGDLQKTFNLLALMYRTSSEDPSISFLYCLGQAVERLLVASTMVHNSTAEEVAERLQMNPWRYKVQIHPHVKRHNDVDLCALLRGVADLDRSLKGGARYGRPQLEVLLYRLCRGHSKT